jgi:hypothetical protein
MRPSSINEEWPMASMTFSRTAAALCVLVSTLAAGGSSGAPSAAASSCPPADQRLAALRAESIAPAVAAKAVDWAPEIEPDAHRLVYSHDLKGPCATSVAGSVMSAGALETGEGFDILPSGRLQRRDAAASLVAPAALQSPPPRLGGAKFIMASRVDSLRVDGKLTTDYVGLWRDKNEWIVASFSQRENANLGSARPILRSRLPLRAVNYFPALDSRSGQLSVTQEVDSQTLRILAFDWRHPTWFAKPS